MRHEATEACPCPAHLIRLISFLLAIRSLVAGAVGMIGIRGTVSCCSPLVPRFSYPHHFPISSDPIALICPHPLIRKAGGADSEDETGTRKTRRRDETKDKTPDETRLWRRRDGGQASNETKRRDGDTRRRTRRPLMRTNDNDDDGDGMDEAVPLCSKHATRTETTREWEYLFIFRPTLSPRLSLIRRPQTSPPPPGRGMSKQENGSPCRRHKMMSRRGWFNRAAHSAHRSFAIPVSSVPCIVAAAYPAPFSEAHSPVPSLILLPRRRHSFPGFACPIVVICPRLVSSSPLSRPARRLVRAWSMAWRSHPYRVVRSLWASKQDGGRAGPCRPCRPCRPHGLGPHRRASRPIGANERGDVICVVGK